MISDAVQAKNMSLLGDFFITITVTIIVIIISLLA